MIHNVHFAVHWCQFHELECQLTLWGMVEKKQLSVLLGDKGTLSISSFMCYVFFTLLIDMGSHNGWYFSCSFLCFPPVFPPPYSKVVKERAEGVTQVFNPQYHKRKERERKGRKSQTQRAHTLPKSHPHSDDSLWCPKVSTCPVHCDLYFCAPFLLWQLLLRTFLWGYWGLSTSGLCAC
jgi:hypothetical protein